MKRLRNLLAAIRCENRGHRRATVITFEVSAEGVRAAGHEHTCLRCKATFPCLGGAS